MVSSVKLKSLTINKCPLAVVTEPRYSTNSSKNMFSGNLFTADGGGWYTHAIMYFFGESNISILPS